MNILRRLSLALALALAMPLAAQAQWQALATQPTFTYGAGEALLLTDGSVLVHDENAHGGGGNGSDWKRLIPDNTGSYQNGHWVNAGDTSAWHYGPLYFGSAVLADGRVVVIGGEYNLADNGGNAVETNKGAIYDPITNTWSQLTGPGWSEIGDPPSCVLPNGKFMIGDLNSAACSILDPVTLTWSSTGSGKADANGEEGWTLLPNNKILTVDCSNIPHTELYDIATGTWSSAGNTSSTLPEAPGAGYVPEMGPGVLMYNGTVFEGGATGHTGIYNWSTNTWSAGPDFPGGDDQADAPGALMPNGHVLLVASPGAFNNPANFYEWDGASLTPVANPPGAGSESSFLYRMLVLPTGQVLVTKGTNDVEIYTPTGGPSPLFFPTITVCPAMINPASTISISGTQFNGLSQANNYGDDAANATNYPIVRIRNTATGHVFYCRTHDHSTMGIATGATIVSTSVDVPASVELGPSTLYVVANGIPSVGQVVTIGTDDPPTTTSSLSGTVGNNGWYRSSVTVTLHATDPQGAGDIANTYYKVDGGSQQTYTGPFVVSGNLIHSVEYWSVDNEAAEELPHNTIQIKIDTINPTLVFGSPTPAPNSHGWNNTAVNIPFTPSDNLSGVAGTVPANPLHFTSEGVGQTQNVVVTDNAGNSANFVSSPPLKIDLTAPVSTAGSTGFPQHNGWYLGNAQVTMSATDALSGVDQILYKIDGGPTQVYTGPITLAGDGLHQVQYWATDLASNIETAHILLVGIDTTPPTITVTANPLILTPNDGAIVPVTVSGTITDAVSGPDPKALQWHLLDEYSRLQPSGIVHVAADGSFSFVLMLERSRLPADTDGRTYQIAIGAGDRAGNIATKSVIVLVP